MKMTSLITAAPIAITFAIGSASAEQSNVQEMRAGMSGLEIRADRILDKNGFEDVDPTTLSLSTLVEIIDVERNDDERAGSTRGGIQAALNR